MEVNSTNPEMESSFFDNIIGNSVNIHIETDISINGIAVDALTYYNISDYENAKDALKEADLGPQLRTIYEISNGGPSTVNKAEMFILIPHLTITGDHLMYIVDKPETTGNVQCVPSNNIDVLGLKISEPLTNSSSSRSGGDVRLIPGSRTIQSLENRFKFHDRIQTQSIAFNDIDLKDALVCNITQCAIIRCVIGPLEKDNNAIIAIRTRLVAETLNKVLLVVYVMYLID